MNDLSIDCVFPVVLTYGRGKPSNLDFLTKGIRSVMEILTNGLPAFPGINFRLKSFVADLPAKAFVKNVLQYNSISGCDRCDIKGFCVF